MVLHGTGLTLTGVWCGVETVGRAHQASEPRLFAGDHPAGSADPMAVRDRGGGCPKQGWKHPRSPDPGWGTVPNNPLPGQRGCAGTSAGCKPRGNRAQQLHNAAPRRCCPVPRGSWSRRGRAAAASPKWRRRCGPPSGRCEPSCGSGCGQWARRRSSGNPACSAARWVRAGALPSPGGFQEERSTGGGRGG